MGSEKIFGRMREDHAMVLEAIGALDEAALQDRSQRADPKWPGGKARAVLATLAWQFRTHLAAEDEVLYPSLLNALPCTRPSIEPLFADHAALRTMLVRIEESLRDSPSASRNERIAVQLRDFVDLLRIHIRKEELVVFAVAERVLPARVVKALAARMERDPPERPSQKPRSKPGTRGRSRKE